jgi:hypothetical protein
MAVEPFARPSLELSRPLVGGLEVAAAPSGGQGLALDETGRIPSGLLWTRYRKVTSKTISNSTSTTDLLNSEIVIPAGALLANGILRLTAWGSFVQNTGGTTNSPRWAVALGGTTLLDTSALTSSATTSAQECTWRVVAIVEAADALNAQVVHLDVDFFSPSPGGIAVTFAAGTGLMLQDTAVGGFAFARAKGHNTGSKDMAAPQALALNATLPTASASYTITLKGALVEIL